MSCWPSIAASPPELWCAFARMRDILRANTEHDGCEHEGALLDPEHVRLDDHQDVAHFFYPHDVSYTYHRELQVVFEDRPGVHAAYTRRGRIAYATSTSAGAEPLARLLEVTAPPGARWN